MGRRDLAVLAVLVLVSATHLALVGLRRLWTLRASTYDLVIYDQGVRNYSRFDPPASPVMGVRSGLGPDFTLLGDHFSPVLALLAPLYWVHDGPETLVVAQAVLLAAAAVPLWVLARRELGGPAAWLVAIAYSLAWPVIDAADFDVHEVAFAPLLTAVLLERWSAWRRGRARWWHVGLAGLAVACVKEDMGLLLAGFGLAVLLMSLTVPRACPRATPGRTAMDEVPGRARTAVMGVSFASGGLVWTAAMAAFVIPALGGELGQDWRYDQFGATPVEAVRAVLADPGAALVQFVRPDIKLDTILLLAALCVGVVVSPYTVMVVPLLAARMLSDNPLWWLAQFHYNAFLVVPVLVAGIDGIGWLARRTDARVGGVLTIAWSAAALLIGLAFFVRAGDAEVFDRETWRRDAWAAAGARAAAVVPDGAFVEAPNNLGPQLTGRAVVLLLDESPHGAPWVVVDTTRRHFPFCELDDQVRRADDLVRQGYEVVGRTGGWVVLHDPAATPDLDHGVRPKRGC